MNPCLSNMLRGSLLFFAVTTVQAITITIDRADVKNLPPQSSMSLNGWRPVTTRYEEIGVNVSPATNLERNPAPLHPVLNKLQEHMATSERLKPQRKSKPQDYNPPSILGSFTVFGHAAAKARGDGNAAPEKKYPSKETKEYSFLIPPPRDTFRFEIEPHKKAVLRESDSYIRPSQFMSQVHKPDLRGPTYYIKSPMYSTTAHPMLSSKNRPVAAAFSAQPMFVQQRQPIKSSAFESLKVANLNNKQYIHMTKSEIPQAVVAQSEHTYERYTPQSHIATVNGNFYNQVSHAPQNYKTTFERDPSFLVHESHEVGFVTPPFDYKFRHPVPFESLIRPDVYPSTTAPRVEGNKHAQPVNNYRNDQVKPVEQKRNNPAHSTEKTVHPTYYVAEAHHDFIPPQSAWQMKQQYKPDINEVLPKINSPAHFSQQSSSLPIHPLHPQYQKLVYVRPEIQQQKQQYHGSIIPLNINQKHPQVEFETPESLSLKHFNEQQFMLQQQLIEQDRRRLQEQGALRQKQLEKHEQEEISQKQEELRILQRQHQQHQHQHQQQQLQQQQEQEQEQNQKQQHQHQQQQQQANLEQQDFKKEIPKRKQNTEVTKSANKVHNHRYAERNKHKQEVPKEVPEVKVYSTQIPQQQFYEVPQVSTEPTFHFTDDAYSNQQGQRYEISGFQNNDYYTTLVDGIQYDNDFGKLQTDQRDPARRKKPTYDRGSSTSYPTGISDIESYTEIPIQTTARDVVTTPAVEKIRTRKPTTNSNSAPRRRRPSTTTPEPDTVGSIIYAPEEFYKYENKQSENKQPEVPDQPKRRRPSKPQSNNDSTPPTEVKKPTRKRPNHRNNIPTAPEIEIITTTEPTTPISFVESNKAQENQEQTIYNQTENFEYTPVYSSQSPVEYQPEVVTESIVTELPNIQAGKLTKFEYYEPTSPDFNSGQFGFQKHELNLPLEHLFVRTEPGNYETTTSHLLQTENLPSVTPTKTTIKISKSQEVSKAIVSVHSTTTQPSVATVKSHRTRPLRYGNNTRPRFSVKDYKTRMDLKNKITQNAGSTTEQPQASQPIPRKRPTGQRNSQPVTNDPTNVRESTGRYKYMSRVSYKTSTTTPTSFESEKENVNPSTEKTKFAPKRRLNTNLYRSRFSSTKSGAEGAQNQNASRPETQFTTVRRRVTGSKTNGEKKGPVTEMAAEETSFYTQPTTPQYTESVNEIADKEHIQRINQSDHETQKNSENVDTAGQNLTSAATDGQEQTSDVASATPYNVQLEEELFAKASQSVADLTSSASALYNKPGLFKAVSSGHDNRKSNKLQITTEEATLPIEAFFQELSKKVE